mmetsp:Transcript_113361/g.320829  ORF Transcript_113361/g.320829 Transcript_113361/m.320829 type:complete len:216 (+) Transcript_113361:372-1019(+)
MAAANSFLEIIPSWLRSMAEKRSQPGGAGAPCWWKPAFQGPPLMGDSDLAYQLASRMDGPKFLASGIGERDLASQPATVTGAETWNPASRGGEISRVLCQPYPEPRREPTARSIRRGSFPSSASSGLMCEVTSTTFSTYSMCTLGISRTTLLTCGLSSWRNISTLCTCGTSMARSSYKICGISCTISSTCVSNFGTCLSTYWTSGFRISVYASAC